MRFARILIAMVCLAIAPSAFAQSTVINSGAVTPAHAPMYVQGGVGSQVVTTDSGPAGGGNVGLGLSEQLLVARGTGVAPYAGQGSGPLGTNLCDYDAPITNATGYHYLCFSANAQGGALIATGAGGSASTQPLCFIVNGAPICLGGTTGLQIATYTPPTTPGLVPCWTDAFGQLGDCTGAAATLIGNPSAGSAKTGPFTLQSLPARGAPDANNDKLLILNVATGQLDYVTPGLIASSATAGVSSLGGVTGAITLGTGLSISGSTLSNSGVTSIASQTGAIALGSGLSMTGSTLNSVASGTNGQVQYNNGGAFGGLTNTQLTTLVQQFTPTLSGDVPASGGGTSNYLRADGTWASPSAIPTYNPIDYGAVGNGIADDTVAWQTMCSAISTAGAGWIVSPPGKTYKVFFPATTSDGAKLCPLTGVSSFRLSLNGSQFISNYIAQVAITGTATNGDTLSWQFSSWLNTFTSQTVAVTVTGGETTTQMAAALTAAINGNSTLSANSIAATSTGNVINITSTNTQITWYVGNTNGTPGLVVTGAGTEVLTQSQVYGFYILNSTNLTFDELTATAYSGRAVSGRGQYIDWVQCNSGGLASPNFGCRNMAVHNINANGGLGAVSMVRRVGTGDWSRSIEADGYATNLGYPFSNENDGEDSTFNFVDLNVGRSYIGYNICGVHGRIRETRTLSSIGLNSMEVTSYASSNDISNNTTCDVWLDYTNMDTPTAFQPVSYIAVIHQQGDLSVSNIPSHLDNLHFNLNVTIPATSTSEIMENGAYSGNASNESPGDVTGNSEYGNTISGVVNGAGTGSFIGCIMAASNGGCVGYSGLTLGDWHLSNLRIQNDTRPWAVGKGVIATFGPSYNQPSAPSPTLDSGFTSANMVFAPPTYFSNVSGGGTSCASSSTVTVSHGLITSC